MVAAPHVVEIAFATFMHSDATCRCGLVTAVMYLRSHADDSPSHLNTHHRMHWPLKPFFTSQDLRKTQPQLPQTRMIAPMLLTTAMAGAATWSAHPSGASYRNSSLSSATSSSSSVSGSSRKRSFEGKMLSATFVYTQLLLERGSESNLGEGAWLTYLRLSG
jgi:hypothetical protein